ncbi:hypothetical protein [Clostridium gasigenes]|uniref:hypothetical protein n=1 Tax=Clostridium gasigenes TaxID=94869 RepID=UPI001C0D383F|nr:hypothetical protein [Clostridium gasigenes]MBU3107485.1 hypothetical protein [Clostridium gasigenes]
MYKFGRIGNNIIVLAICMFFYLIWLIVFIARSMKILLITTMNVIPLKETVNKWDENEYGIIYGGKRSWGNNSEQSSEGRKKPSGNTDMIPLK